MSQVMNEKQEHKNKESIPRRKFIKVLWTALISISILEVGAVIISFLTSGGRKDKEGSRLQMKVLGKVDDFEKGSVTAFRSDKLYLVRMEDGGLLALSLQCTHLGCAITWNEESGEFDCPCHASSFNSRGEVIKPPAPRALDTYPLKIEGGLIKADISRSVKRNSFNKTQVVYA